MALCHPNVPCAICGQPVGHDKNNILGFDFIEISQPEFRCFSDGLAHISCLSGWERRDEFIEAWNRALSEYYGGKQLRIGADGRVNYTDSATWRIQHSPAVQRRNAGQRALLEEKSQRRREDLSNRMEAARQKAIRLGLANSSDVNEVIRNLPLDKFQLYLGEFQVSRAFFKQSGE